MTQVYKNVSLILNDSDMQKLHDNLAVFKAQDGIRTRVILRNDEKRNRILEKIEKLQKQLDSTSSPRRKKWARSRKKLCTPCNKRFAHLKLHIKLKHQGMVCNLPVVKAALQRKETVNA